MIIEVPEVGMRIKPYTGDTCWQVEKWATGRKKKGTEKPLSDKWVGLGYYASNIPYGLTIIAELAMKKSPSEHKSIMSAVEEIKTILEATRVALRASVADETTR